jgi:succinoglycan biosynthesis transport protein ExoP
MASGSSWFSSPTLIPMQISQVPSSNHIDQAVPAPVVTNGQALGSALYLPHPLLSPLPGTSGQSFNLSQLTALLRRRFLLFSGITLLTFGGLFYRTLSQPPVYSGSLDMLIEPVVKSDGENVILNLARGSDASQLNYESQIRILRSPEVLKPILQKVQQRYPKITYKDLHTGLSIARDGDADVLRITYKGPNSNQVAFVLEEISQGYINYSVVDRQEDLKRGLNFIDQQTKEKLNEVDRLERDLGQLQKKYNVVDVNAAKTSVTERMNAMQAQQESLELELISLMSLQSRLQQQVGFNPDAAVQISDLTNSPNYQKLLSQLREIEQQIALESARFTPNTPIIQSLQDRRQQILPLLQAEAERTLSQSLDVESLGFKQGVVQDLLEQLVATHNRLLSVETQYDMITLVTEDLQKETEWLADLSRRYSQYGRELAVAENNLNQLMANRQDLRLQMARKASPWKVVSDFGPSSVVPMNNLPRDVAANVLASLFLGGVAAFLWDKQDQAIHDVEELLAVTQLPELALVPESPILESRLLAMTPRLLTGLEDAQLAEMQPTYSSFSFTEAFYSLDANLRLLSSDNPVQVVGFTSAKASEGKSTVIAHLAIAAAAMGRRVLLIDADLRKPSQHEFFDLPNEIGLSNLISQSHLAPEEGIYALAENPNLHLITAGAEPPAPGRLLSSQKLHQMIDTYRQNYDLILIDGPPLAGISDAKLIATHVDGVVLVSRLGKLSRPELSRLMALWKSTTQAPLLGLVVNRITKRERAYVNDYGQLSSRQTLSSS